MIPSAQNYYGVVLNQRGQSRVRICHLGMINDNESQVFAGKTGGNLVSPSQLQLIMSNGEMSRFAGDFYRLFDHRACPESRGITSVQKSPISQF